MYKRVALDNNRKDTLNIGLVILIFLISIFFIRVLNVLKDSKERGGWAYVQLLNFSLPVVEEQAYNEGDFAENNLSIKRVCIEALGLDNISPANIIGGEISYYKDSLASKEVVASIGFNPFVINESSIKKGETTVVPDTVDETLKKPLNTAVPEVLIYHTHTSEAFNGVSDSNDVNSNIVGAGEALKKELEEQYGISVIHDTTNHSESYIGCYQRSGETVKKNLQKYGDFKLIIDLHRDSVDNKNAVTANINGKNAARIMFVNTRNSSRYNKNLELTQKLYNKANEIYPGLTRSIYTYNSGILAFNQDLSDNSVLIECGSYNNTMEEVDNSAKYIARVIAEYINRQ